MFKQMADFQKRMMERSVDTLELVNTRMEKMMSMMWDQTVWATERMGSVMVDWSTIYQKGYETFQKNAEENFAKMGFPQQN
jgi:hypothetical protein